MKHKHAELIKQWADGAKIQWLDSDCDWCEAGNPSWSIETTYRIKPEPRPQWQQDLIDAVKAGKIVQFNDNGWYASSLCWLEDSHNFAGSKQHQYRIKPEPDIVQTCEVSISFASFNSGYPTVQFTFDGETGKLKAAEVL